MTRKAPMLALSSILAILAGVGVRWFYYVTVGGQVVRASSSVSAYQIEQVDYVECNRGPGQPLAEPRESIVYTKARRSSGAKSEVSIWKGLGPNGADRAEKTYITEDGRHVVKSRSDLNIKTTVARSLDDFLRDELDPAQKCMKSFAGLEVAGLQYIDEGVMYGVRTFKLQKSSSSSRSTHWVAPDLGCERVHRIMEFMDASGSVTSRNTLKTISVRLGEPDAAMFQLPQNFEEIGPWEEFRRDYHLRKGPSPAISFVESLSSSYRLHLERLESSYQLKKSR